MSARHPLRPMGAWRGHDSGNPRILLSLAGSRPTAAVPLGRALKVAGVFAQPIKVGVKTCDQSFEAGAEARIFYLWVFVEKDVIEVPQAWRRARALQRSAMRRIRLQRSPRSPHHLPLI